MRLAITVGASLALSRGNSVQPTTAGSPPSTVSPQKPARLSGNAELLAWQSRIRILVASFAAMAALALLAARPAPLARPLQPFATVLLATQAYVLLAVFAAMFARRRSAAQEWLVAATVLGDVAFIFVMTAAILPSSSYDRALILAFVAVHLNALYFGRRHSVLLIGAVLVAYSIIVHEAIENGDPLQWSEEMWTLAIFALGSIVVAASQRSLGRRLEALARLFGRAEEGDFTDAYDEDADQLPDAVTHVGRGYNRVRGQLASMVLTDPLTGCVNRRGFDQALARETARTTRAGSELALLAIDVDHFKMVNDTMGHLAGDAVLRQIGALLLHAARAGDVVARTGGEEFTLVLPDTSAAGAYQLAARLCDAIRQHAFNAGSGTTRLTVSIGVAASDAELTGSAHDVGETLKSRADQALYAAKRGGRDRVRAWASDDEEPVVLGV